MRTDPVTITSNLGLYGVFAGVDFSREPEILADLATMGIVRDCWADAFKPTGFNSSSFDHGLMFRLEAALWHRLRPLVSAEAGVEVEALRTMFTDGDMEVTLGDALTTVRRALALARAVPRDLPRSFVAKPDEVLAALGGDRPGFVRLYAGLAATRLDCLYRTPWWDAGLTAWAHAEPPAAPEVLCLALTRANLLDAAGGAWVRRGIRSAAFLSAVDEWKRLGRQRLLGQ